MTLDKSVYFVENIIPSAEGKNDVILWKVPTEFAGYSVSNKENWENIEIVIKNVPLNYFYDYLNRSNDGIILEGNFVYSNDDSNSMVFENANGDKIAKREVLYNNYYRGLGLKNYSETNEKNDMSKPLKYEKVEEVYSYHVNVGHGNCSIIVYRKNGKIFIFMIDCSVYDFLQKRNYSNNLEDCIHYIKEKFQLESFYINHFFLTHPHFDHFNGLKFLVNNNYLFNTEIWINFHFSWPQSQYSETLKLLYNNGNIFHDPIVINSQNYLSIIHPENSLQRLSKNRLSGKKINNSSAVYRFGFNEKSIVLPGDLESEGWDCVNQCYPYLQDCTYYCISHHGSKNGHQRNICPKLHKINSVAECIPNVKYALLMGRDKAFKGIFNKVVLDDFGSKLIKIDKPIRQGLIYSLN
jgi:hypothetical protein